MQRLRRFAKFWDLVGNSGNFLTTTPLIWNAASAFKSFLRFSDWLYARTNRTNSIALVRLMELLFEFLTDELQLAKNLVAETLWRDYRRGGRHDKPIFLKDFLATDESLSIRKSRSTLPKRQARHLV
jgi:hypothetical protein